MYCQHLVILVVPAENHNSESLLFSLSASIYYSVFNFQDIHLPTMIDAAALQGVKLRKTETTAKPDLKSESNSKSESLASTAKITSVTKIRNESDRREYFFSSGIDAWYEPLKDVTFPSLFIALTFEEKLALLSNYLDAFREEITKEQGKEEVDEIEGILKRYVSQNPEGNGPVFGDGGAAGVLANLAERIDRGMGEMREQIEGENRNCGFFVKLSTRSPKDSRSVLRRAEELFKKEVQAVKSDSSSSASDMSSISNLKWTLLAECVRQACCVRSGEEALEVLSDSRRVGEDIKYEMAEIESGGGGSGDPINTSGNIINTNTKLATPPPISLVLRPFDQRVTPATEFRGFVWNGKFTCAGQYFYELYFPELQSEKAIIAADLQRFWQDEVRGKLFGNGNDSSVADSDARFGTKVPCFMMDLVWIKGGAKEDAKKTGRGNQVLLVEINPFDGEGLGAFPASTGLFNWDDPGDRRVMMGESKDTQSEFTLRLCTEVPDQKRLERNKNPAWVRLIKS